MKLNRPDTYIPYGPIGCTSARFFFEYEDISSSAALGMLRQQLAALDQSAYPRGSVLHGRKTLADEGYVVLLVRDNEVSDEVFSALPVPPMYKPAAPGESGRKLEDFPNTVAGYYQHYRYEPFVNQHPGCDHDFGLENVKYVIKLAGADKTTPLGEAVTQGIPEGSEVFLTTTCARCGDVHALRQSTASGQPSYR